MNNALSGSVAWTERYESLRHYVLEGRSRLQAQPLGLALWLSRNGSPSTCFDSVISGSLAV